MEAPLVSVKPLRLRILDLIRNEIANNDTKTTLQQLIEPALNCIDGYVRPVTWIIVATFILVVLILGVNGYVLLQVQNLVKQVKNSSVL